MSEEIINPEVLEENIAQSEAPVVETPVAEEPVAEEPKAEELNLADKSLSELSDVFRLLMESADRMTRSKEAEAIKSAFYKLLGKLKSEASEVGDTFDAVEENFKGIYADYKRERAEYNKEQDALKEENLEKKKAIIEELKALVDGSDDVSSAFPAFREIQNRWKDVGPVPATAFRDINSTYQFNVERFYDKVKINRELRDLDFQKNLEAKEKFCEAAEKLAANDNIVSAFNELQKLHEQWKEFGPVAKEFRESIWARFQAATAVVNKRYQAHFEELKGKQKENLAAKEALCEKVEEIAAREVGSSEQWNAFAKEIEAVQAEWRKIGFATKKENQKIYDRFRAACDAFYGRKREYYSQFRSEMDGNLEKKLDLIRQANELKLSTEWKKATEKFIELQKQWREIGAVPRKKSEQLWKQFRGACDEFFAERDKNASPENNYYANLKAKKKLIEDIKAYVPADADADKEAAAKFAADFQAIGFVPFKEKDNVNAAFREAMAGKFPSFVSEGKGGRQRSEGRTRERSAKDILIQQYKTLQQEIETFENNIGFFAASKNSEALIKQMESKIAKAKDELRALEERIRKEEEGEQ
ncbi:MAG: DUF349 domain-containing protein [Bacteroidales bacterium]|nr:DUF349 domain-containing protein [Bacteroidales bacterium]